MDLRKEQKGYILALKKLKTICLDFLIGSCKVRYLFDESPGFKLSICTVK